jgi:hypothetical protein
VSLFPFAALSILSTVQALPSFSTVLDWSGPERAVDILVLDSGSCLALGMRSSEYGAPPDLLLIVVDTQGDTVRTVALGGAEGEIPGGMASTDDGGLLIAYTICGASPDSTLGSVLRLDSGMDTLWCTCISDEGLGGLNCVTALPGGACAVAGYSRSVGGDPRMTLGLAALLDQEGDTLWTVSIPGPGPSMLTGVDAGFAGPVFCGTSQEQNGSSIRLLGTDWTGAVAMDVGMAPGHSSEGCAVAVTDGGIMIAGSAPGDHEGVVGMYLAFMDESGSVAWEKTYGGESWDRATALCEAGDGGWLLAGYSRSSAGGEEDRSDLILVRTDAMGVRLWTRIHGTPKPDYCWGAARCSDGGFALAGCVTDHAGGSDYDAWVLRVDSLGNLSGLGHGDPGQAEDPLSALLLGNPCRDAVELRLLLSGGSTVEVLLFDIFGRLVFRPLSGRPLDAGEHHLVLPLTADGRSIPAGVYLLQVISGEDHVTMGVTVLGGGR